ncbi:hypothetical protein N24_1173 [Corynebacterium suranareeae]|uniref:Abi-like protein n=1 Tax=Corynebacterium suranareeae TaxID=2506452 RepID=A0A160PPU3_9CORY|nr:hypothetical protein [Corynebacterium suranareeae]BAU95435.1 hypothetical protein N24_1173 [Corynebacterium suranareeae]
MEGNKKRALTLYRWSVELTASIQETLGITEVILRNSIDNQLQRWNDNEKGSPTSWLLHEPARPLLSLTQGKRLEAQKRARKSADLCSENHSRSGQPITHDDVLAHTMFGMWKDILPNHGLNADPNKIENRNRRRLWEEAIEMAFSLADDPTGETTYWRVTHLHGLRNRVSHMDSLFNVDVIDIINDPFALVGSIDPALVDWITGTSTVRSVHSRRPK